MKKKLTHSRVSEREKKKFKVQQGAHEKKKNLRHSKVSARQKKN